ncbi:translation initiation factor IF-2 [Candidatus Woesearchaeota archaeon]|nr:translation initiation factor IF-2 [Candidatus Woesearchaeota archaeon]
MKTRQPIVTFVGHIDHGKTSLQDYIRESAVTEGEAGKITQHIGSSIIPLETIKKLCGNLLDSLKLDLTLPGLLFIDTPGHAAFNNLRKRGGNLADIAILVININEGVMPQTIECINILKQYKTPFIITLNKIDLIQGWQKKDTTLLQNISSQSEFVQKQIETKLYEIVGKLSENGLNAERFDRVSDYTQQVAMVPTSAHTGEGIPELLMVLTGLAQKFLESCLECDSEGNAKGTILEVREEKGIGKTLDVIVFDGTLKQNDILIIGTLTEPIVTKVRALLEPAVLSDMRDKKSKFQNVKEVVAAAGVKIAAPNIDEVISGMPIMSCPKKDIDSVKNQIQKEVDEVIIETDNQGIVIKADTLGSLEALEKLLRESNITIKKASIGNISKKDVGDAKASYESDPLNCAILGFNVSLIQDVSVPDNVQVLTNNVIYKLIEDFEKWKEKEKKKRESNELDFLVRPCKIQLLKGYVFRQNNPAVVGTEIISGTLKTGTPLMKDDGISITEAKSIQDKQESADKAEKGKQVAVSLPKVTIGRQIGEGDVLYSAIPEEHFRKMKDLKQNLSDEEKDILKEIAKIMRSKNPVWGV